MVSDKKIESIMNRIGIMYKQIKELEKQINEIWKEYTTDELT